MKPLVLGVDPGMSGATVALTRSGKVEGIIKHSETPCEVARFIRLRRKAVVFAVLEKVHSMPRQGVRSSFTFGTSFGLSLGCFWSHRIRFKEETPQKWQGFMKCRTGGDKNISKKAAEKLFPGMKITHATADALLIAEYARQMARKLGYFEEV